MIINFIGLSKKNYADNNPQTQQIDFGELFNKEKVKFNDMFEELNDNEFENRTYKNNEPIKNTMKINDLNEN